MGGMCYVCLTKEPYFCSSCWLSYTLTSTRQYNNVGHWLYTKRRGTAIVQQRGGLLSSVYSVVIIIVYGRSGRSYSLGHWEASRNKLDRRVAAGKTCYCPARGTAGNSWYLVTSTLEGHGFWRTTSHLFPFTYYGFERQPDFITEPALLDVGESQKRILFDVKFIYIRIYLANKCKCVRAGRLLCRIHHITYT
jgi:hypothetical protein